MSAVRRPRSLRSWLPWVGLGLVLVVALFVGTRHDGGPPSDAARVDKIASGLKCPTCRSISVAQSDAITSKAIKDEILRQVREGRSDSEIRASIIGKYGVDLLIQPQGSGISALVWALPVVALVLGAALLAYAFRRWSRLAADAPTPSDADRALVEEARVEEARVEEARVEEARGR